MKPAGQIVADCYREVAKLIEPGITTREINDFVARHITKLGGKQFTKGYNGFPQKPALRSTMWWPTAFLRIGRLWTAIC